MNLIDRVKNILTTPKTEWLVIRTETATPGSLLTGYVLPLSLLPAAAAILGSLIHHSTMMGLITAGIAIVGAIISFYISLYVTDALAPSFDSEKNLNRSAQLVAYSYTASAVAGVLGFIPVLGGLIALAGAIYGIYLLYLGIGPMKNTPDDKKVIYIVVIILIQLAIYFVITAVLTGLIISSVLGGVGAAAMFH